MFWRLNRTTLIERGGKDVGGGGGCSSEAVEDDVLSQEECQHFIAASEEAGLGFHSGEGVVNASHRTMTAAGARLG